MVDQHIHTNYSPDSKVSIEAYLKEAKRYGCDYLIITDHFDFLKVLDSSSLNDNFENFDKLFEKVNSMKDPSIKVGIEVGYNNLAIEETTAMLNKYDFSIVLLSVHDDDANKISYFYASDSGNNERDIILHYINQVEESVNSTIDYDVISHIGYIFRYFDSPVNPLDYIDSFDNILKSVAKKNKALELNTGCLRKNVSNITEFYTEILKRFKMYGGQYVSIGSDAHDAKSFLSSFDIATSILLKAGYTQCVEIVDRNFVLVDLEIPVGIPDQHMHTIYSPDSKVKVEDYLSRMELLGVDYITLTDHIDILKNIEKHSHHDYFGAFEKLFCSRFDERVKIGIEVGYNKTTEKETIELLNKYNFSLVILSCHDNDLENIRYYRVNDLDLSDEEIISIYVEHIESALNSNIDFDILGHLGFVFRYMDDVDPVRYVPHFSNILQQVIDKRKALEFNTSCFYYGTSNIEEFYYKIFKQYYELGGRYVSIGSDAHALTSYSRDFNYAVKFLKNIGFDSTTIIKDREFTQCSI